MSARSTAPDVASASELVRRRAEDDGDGLVFEGRTWTWRDVIAEASARAALLAERRREGPFHVGVLLENTPEYVFLLAAAALSGAVVVGVNPSRRGEQLAADVRHTDCQLFVTDSTQVHLVDGLDLGVAPERMVLADGQDHLAAVAAHAKARLPNDIPAPDDLYLLIFTSGSTGAPKAVQMTQGRAARGAARMPFTADDVLYSAMPLFHGNALNSIIFPAWFTGATVALRRRFSASQFLPDVIETGATFTNTVGRAVAHVLATPPTDRDRDHRLKFVLGPETSDQDRRRFTKRFGVPLVQGYGSSENAIIIQPAPRGTKGALGVAGDGDDLAVVDPATGTERPRARFDDEGRLLNAAEATGELVGRNVGERFEGYYNNPEAEAERRRNGWYWSGDLAYRDEAGVFFFAGRTGEWLRVDSENFAAAPVERILQRYEPAGGVAVYAVPDPRTGDQVMAALEIADAESFDAEGFAAFLDEQPDLGTKWAPRYLRIVTSLPVTGTDKVDKKPLATAKWFTTDALWHRPPRSGGYVRFTEDDLDELRKSFHDNGREALLES